MKILSHIVCFALMLTLTAAAHAGELSLTWEWTASGSGMSYPFGLALTPDQSSLYASCMNSSDIHEWTTDTGSHVKEFGSGLKYAYGVATDEVGNIYVTSTGGAPGDRVIAYNPAGTTELFNETHGYGTYDVAVDNNGNGSPYEYAWVLESFTNGGRLIRRYGATTGSGMAGADTGLKIGSGAGTLIDPGFNKPKGIDIDDETGDIFIADTDNNRIVKITQHDAWTMSYTSFGSSGSGEGQFSQPYGVAVDSEGNIWVSERGNDRIQKFAPDFSPLGTFSGAPGHEFGDCWDLIVGDDGAVYVATGNEIQKYLQEGNEVPEPITALAVLTAASGLGTYLRRRRQ